MNTTPLSLKIEIHHTPHGRGGFALATMLCTVVILFIIGMGVLAVGLQSRGLAVRTSSDMVARCAADAGVTKGLFEMNEKLKVIPWDGSSLPQATSETLPNSDAIYSYSVAGDLTNGYNLKSKGNYGLSDKTINCSLSLKGPFESAIFAKNMLTLKAGTLVDGYNSGDPWDDNIDVHIGTKSTLPDSIVLNMGVVVKGNVAVGVGGNVGIVIKDLGASTYRRYSLLQDVDMPVINPPAELVDTDSGINIHGTTVTVGPADTGQYDEIDIRKASNPGMLIVNGGDVVLYVTGDISLGQECQIVIKEGSTLALYLDGDMVAGNNAGINNENVPSSFKLFGTGTEEQKLDLKAKSESLGAIYAPNAIVTIMADSDIFGAISAKSVELKSGGNFYYDKALREVGTEDEAVRFVIRDWREE